MVDKKFLQHIGLTEDQVTLLSEALYKESRYRAILLQEGVSPSCVEAVVRVTKLEEIDLSNEDLLREKVRAEWSPLRLRK